MDREGCNSDGVFDVLGFGSATMMECLSFEMWKCRNDKSDGVLIVLRCGCKSDGVLIVLRCGSIKVMECGSF